MTDWNNLNKVRVHNKSETFLHYISKAIVSKILYNEGYQFYTEHVVKTLDKNYRVADVYGFKGKNKIVVELESIPTPKHNEVLKDFYKKEALYIIDLRKLSGNISEIEEQIRYILGM